MRWKHLRKALQAVLATQFLGLIGLGIMAPQGFAVENVVACTADPTIINYGDIANCTIGPVGDADTLQFPATAGDVISVHITTTLGPGSCRYQVFDANGASLTGITPGIFQGTLPVTGLSSILVLDLSNDQTAECTVVVERISPQSPTAGVIDFNEVVQDAVDPLGDADPFAIYGEEGDDVSVAITTTGGLGSARYQLFAPDGTSLTGITPSIFQGELQQTGTYTVLATDLSNDQAVDYSLNVQCLSVHCGSAPVAVEEIGSFAANSNYKAVEFSGSVPNPVVLVGPPTYNGRDPGTARIRNVTQDGFEGAFKEWDYRARDFGDNSHLTEVMSYLALESGRFVKENGSIWEAGTFPLGGTVAWTRVDFTQAFLGTPYLFLTIQTSNGTQVVTVRARNVDSTGFEAALFEEEALNEGHTTETVGYLAIFSPVGPKSVPFAGEDLPYLLHRTNITHEFTTVLSAQLKLEEEQSADLETGHISESIDVMAIGDQLFAQETSSAGGDTVSIRRSCAPCVP